MGRGTERLELLTTLHLLHLLLAATTTYLPHGLALAHDPVASTARVAPAEEGRLVHS